MAVTMASLIWETFSILKSKREKAVQRLASPSLPSLGLFELRTEALRGISKMQVAPESDSQLQVSRVTAAEN